MTLLAAIAVMLAAALSGRTRSGPAARLGVLRAAVADDPAPASPSARGLERAGVRAAAAMMIGLAAIVVLGGILGVGLAVAASVAAVVVRPGPAPLRVDPDQVPFVVDLAAGCLQSGASMPEALTAAAQAADEALRSRCAQVVAALRAGAPARHAWRGWLDDPWLAPVARTAIRTAHSGAAAADDLLRVSARLRARRRAQALHRVRQASVWLVVPLGLCFLPAFVLVAVVPLVVGLLPSLR